MRARSGPEGLRTAAHGCRTVAGDAERRDALAAFIADGLACGERIAYVGASLEDGSLPDHVGHHTSVEELVARGQLAVIGSGPAADATGAFDAEATAGALEDLVAATVEQGYAGVRVFTDAGALADRLAAPQDWIRYELLISRAIARSALLGLCVFSADTPEPTPRVVVEALHDPPAPPSAGSTTFHVRVEDDATLAVDGEIDAFCVNELLEILGAALASKPRALDLAGLEFVDLAAAAAIHQATTGTLEIAGAPELLRRIWTLLGLEPAGCGERA